MATAFMMKPNGAVPVSRMIDVIDGAVDPGFVGGRCDVCYLYIYLA